jgi:hypothetical protein
MSGKFSVRVDKRPGSPCWWATAYFKGDGGKKVRWSTQLPLSEPQEKALELATMQARLRQITAENKLAARPKREDGTLPRWAVLPDKLLEASRSMPNMIYFIQLITVERPIKVGTTNNLIRRIQNIASSAPGELRVLGIMPGGIKEERALHEKFWYARTYGEWFAPVGDLIKFIDENAVTVKP